MHYIIMKSGIRIGIYQCEHDECELLQISLMCFDAMQIIVNYCEWPLIVHGGHSLYDLKHVR